MISTPTYFERSETNPSVSASPSQLPYRGAEITFYIATRIYFQN